MKREVILDVTEIPPPLPVWFSYLWLVNSTIGLCLLCNKVSTWLAKRFLLSNVESDDKMGPFCVTLAGIDEATWCTGKSNVVFVFLNKWRIKLMAKN